MSYSKNTIYSTIIQCNYDKNYFNHITTNINTINEKRFTNFSIQKIDYQGKQIMQVFLDIQVVYNNSQKYNIPISIIIPIKFPYEPPFFNVLLKGNNTIFNQENKEINPNSGKISVKSILHWDYTMTLYDILKEVSICFNNIFPILQAPPGQNVNNQTQTQNFNTNRNSIINPNLSNQNNVVNQNVNFNKTNDNFRDSNGPRKTSQGQSK